MNLVRYYWNGFDPFVKVALFFVGVALVLMAIDVIIDPCAKYDPQNRCMCIEFKTK